MKQEFNLQPGDVIYLPDGMEVVNPNLPGFYYKDQHPFTKKTSDGWMTIGHPRRRLSFVKPLHESVTKMIKFVFAYHEMPVNGDILDRFIRHQIPDPRENELTIQRGEYVVTAVEQEDNRNRKVFCKRLPDLDFEIYFYERSNYLQCYPNMKVIRKIPR